MKNKLQVKFWKIKLLIESSRDKLSFINKTLELQNIPLEYFVTEFEDVEWNYVGFTGCIKDHLESEDQKLTTKKISFKDIFSTHEPSNYNIFLDDRFVGIIKNAINEADKFKEYLMGLDIIKGDIEVMDLIHESIESMKLDLNNALSTFEEEYKRISD